MLSIHFESKQLISDLWRMAEMTPLAAAQAEVDQVTDIMKDNVGKVRKTFIAADELCKYQRRVYDGGFIMCKSHYRNKMQT